MSEAKPVILEEEDKAYLDKYFPTWSERKEWPDSDGPWTLPVKVEPPKAD